uniref:Uncharacterized protein n=1 Tax=Rhizophora mucronata TaxID=61149 RepID=A0A2P2QA48_RHIMU
MLMYVISFGSIPNSIILAISSTASSPNECIASPPNMAFHTNTSLSFISLNTFRAISILPHLLYISIKAVERWASTLIPCLLM